MRRLIFLTLILLFCVPVLHAQDNNTGYQEALRRIEEAQKTGAIELKLDNLGLMELPPELWTLTDLEELYLDRNPFTSLPDAIWKLKNLKRLNLAYISITTLPDSIGQLTHLQYLVIQHGHLQSLPESIGQLSELRVLALAYNQLTTLPDSIGKLTKLEQLLVSNNRLTKLPDSIGQMTGLIGLDVSYNRLHELPISLANLPELQPSSVIPWLSDGNPLTFPPPEVVSQGNVAVLEYLRDYPGIILRQTIATIAGSIGAVAGFVLLYRWRIRHGVEKKKRA